jgi:ectoine hydroxylase-related dioxygenase (phytanoyl-CoA dioxygenase family)
MSTAVLPDADTVVNALDADGYTVVEGVLDGDRVAAIRADLDPIVEALPSGRNSFEGYSTKRIYSLLAKTRTLDEVMLHPLVLEVADRVLGHNQLSATVGISIGPGEAAQSEHFDDGIYPLPRPHPEIVLSTMWALDDFVPENGATVMLPGSHRWTDRHPTADSERRYAAMPAGSVAFYLGTLWHGGGANRTDRRRLGITIEYLASWLRPQENHLIALPRELVATLPERLQDLVGWNIRPPFVGYVDGRDPKKLLKGEAGVRVEHDR